MGNAGAQPASIQCGHQSGPISVANKHSAHLRAGATRTRNGCQVPEQRQKDCKPDTSQSYASAAESSRTCMPTPSLERLAVSVEVEPLANACVVDSESRPFSPVQARLLDGVLDAQPAQGLPGCTSRRQCHGPGGQRSCLRGHLGLCCAEHMGLPALQQQEPASLNTGCSSGARRLHHITSAQGQAQELTSPSCKLSLDSESLVFWKGLGAHLPREGPRLK